MANDTQLETEGPGREFKPRRADLKAHGVEQCGVVHGPARVNRVRKCPNANAVHMTACVLIQLTTRLLLLARVP